MKRRLKGNLHCYNKWKLNCWKYSLNFNSLKNKCKEHFNARKYGYEYRLFSLLNFPRAAILNFYDVKWLPLLFRIDLLLYATIEQPCDVINIQNGRAREI